MNRAEQIEQMKCPSKQYPECWDGCPERPVCFDVKNQETEGDKMMEQHEHIWMYERPINGVVYKHCRLCPRREVDIQPPKETE